MKKGFFLTLVLGVFCFFSGFAFADIVSLTNGNILEGIITQETAKNIELEVFLDAKITFSKKEIAKIDKCPREENQALKDKWIEDKKDREKAELARQEFESEQRELGLVKHNGRWIPQSEKEDIETREYIDDVLRAKGRQGKIAQSGRKRTDISRALLARGSWKFRQTEHFIIYYEDVMQSKIVADRAEYYYEKIIYDLNYEKTIYWPEKCEIFIVPNEEKWKEYMREFVRRIDHVGGFVPRSESKEMYLCALSLPYLSVTFPHELTHLIFRDFAEGERIPLWLNEGLAIYESGLIGYADELLINKIKEAQHIPLNELLGMDNYPKTKEAMELYYAEAEKVVEFLITQHGRGKFSRFSKLLIADKNFSEALDFVYGGKYYNLEEFNRAWIKYILK